MNTERFNALLKQNGLTLKAIGEQIGVSHNVAGKWACGMSVPSAKNLQKIADFFKVDIKELQSQPIDFVKLAREVKENLQGMSRQGYEKLLYALRQNDMNTVSDYLIKLSISNNTTVPDEIVYILDDNGNEAWNAVLVGLANGMKSKS